mmetsp:Transcript_25229/g.52490  ORF Transcript_25229/g.52490 Transcript_25229/m.52490 type:complete len:150 (+) Transcript_25229:123-572(+)
MNGGSENTPTTALPEESLRCFPIHKKNPPFLKRNLLYMSNKEDKELEAAESTNREILYHFHTTIKVKGKAQVVTHFRTDTKCPLCGVEVNDIETLWMHMTTTNNNHTFSVLKDAEGQVGWGIVSLLGNFYLLTVDLTSRPNFCFRFWAR